MHEAAEFSGTLDATSSFTGDVSSLSGAFAAPPLSNRYRRRKHTGDALEILSRPPLRLTS